MQMTGRMAPGEARTLFPALVMHWGQEMMSGGAGAQKYACHYSLTYKSVFWPDWWFRTGGSGRQCGEMDRKVWQDHLILCSKLIVQQAKMYTGSSAKTSNGFTHSHLLQQRSGFVTPIAGRTEDEVDCDSGKSGLQLCQPIICYHIGLQPVFGSSMVALVGLLAVGISIEANEPNVPVPQFAGWNSGQRAVNNVKQCCFAQPIALLWQCMRLENCGPIFFFFFFFFFLVNTGSGSCCFMM